MGQLSLLSSSALVRTLVSLDRERKDLETQLCALGSGGRGVSTRIRGPCPHLGAESSNAQTSQNSVYQGSSLPLCTRGWLCLHTWQCACDVVPQGFLVQQFRMHRGVLAQPSASTCSGHLTGVCCDFGPRVALSPVFAEAAALATRWPFLVGQASSLSVHGGSAGRLGFDAEPALQPLPGRVCVSLVDLGAGSVMQTEGCALLCCEQ